MLGAIIGDVVGSIYEVEEIMAIKNKKDNYLNRIKILDSSIPLFTNESSYTDDSVLTTALANAILTNTDYAKNLKEFGLREISLGLDKYGRSRFSTGFCEWLKGNYIGESCGNGCAMRVSPIANYFDDLKQVIKNTREATYPSHNSIEALKSAEMVSLVIYLAKQKKSKEFIKEYIENNYDCDLNFDLEDLQRNYKFSAKAIDSVPQAIFCFLESNSFEDAIRKSISIGGDSDTIAAITGSIASAYYGVPNNLRRKVLSFFDENLDSDLIKIIMDFEKKYPTKNETKFLNWLKK